MHKLYLSRLHHLIYQLGVQLMDNSLHYGDNIKLLLFLIQYFFIFTFSSPINHCNSWLIKGIQI